MQIIPSILATSPEQYQKDFYKLSKCEGLKMGWVHIDFADNIFVQNETVKVDTVEKFPADFKKEAHLMVSEPKAWIDDLINAGFERIIVHVEIEGVAQVINYIKSKGIEAGIAIKNETAIEKLEVFKGKIDTILIMSIVAGFQGQPFIPQVLEKVRQLKSMGGYARIGVDGAVRDKNIREIADSGADFVIVGSYLLQGDTDENLENLWEVING